MDHDTFDALTRSAVTDAGTRRGLLRLLAGSALGGLLARLGLAEVAEAKAKKHGQGHEDRKRPGQVHAAGKAHKKHQNKNKNKDKGQPPRPQPPCPDGQGRCPSGECVAWDACCPDAIPPLCNACDDVVCEHGNLVCRSRCQFADSICCNGECVLPCGNGCEPSGDCGSCTTAPAGKIYCAAQDRCVSTSCPPGQDFDAAACQCKEHCPAGVSMVCPPVPARDDWQGTFGDVFSLPQGCCGRRYWFEDGQGITWCATPGGHEPVVWKCSP